MKSVPTGLQSRLICKVTSWKPVISWECQLAPPQASVSYMFEFVLKFVETNKELHGVSYLCSLVTDLQ